MKVVVTTCHNPSQAQAIRTRSPAAAATVQPQTCRERSVATPCGDPTPDNLVPCDMLSPGTKV
jgi:hypothetical protein